MRRGPEIVGYKGIGQPLADGLKLFLKEHIIPINANKIIFLLSPLVTFVLCLMGWVVIPFTENVIISNINLGILYLLVISSLNVYGIIIAGWASNSRYAFLGSLRSVSQMISYEVSIGIIVISILLVTGTTNLIEIVKIQEGGNWLILSILPIFILFFISCLAETSRTPFDLPEAEGELVAGYNVEYSSMLFALFFLGEYANILLMSVVCVLLFLGGWSSIGYITTLLFSIKVFVILNLFIYIRAILPRLRYDQLMQVGWKIVLPIALGLVIMYSSIMI
jgi:NADH-quinone oxidoreductase subunit H